MKPNRTYVPLAAFLVPTVLCTIILIPREWWIIMSFSFFLMGFTTTYCSMVAAVRTNRDAVVKMGERRPVILPILFFLVPTLVSTVLFIPRKLHIILQFGGCLVSSLVAYRSGVRIVLKDAKNEVRKRNKIPDRSAESRDIPVPGHGTDDTEDRTAVSIVGKKRLVLVNPVNPARTGLTFNKSSRFPPLGLGIVASLTPPGWDVVLVDENIEPFRYERADLVGITSFTASANRAYEIAGLYRKNGTPVIMGGIHASMLPHEALEHVDSVVVGEAESVWKTVVSDFEGGILRQLYRGERLDLSGVPVLRRDLFSGQYMFATVQTSRGCPMDCEFCSVTPFNGKEFRQRDVEEVLSELETIPDQFIFFVDDNILGYGKAAEERAIRLFRGMAERNLGKKWFCQASLNFGSNEEVPYWAAKSGCKMVFIGLESQDPDELRIMKKNMNLSLEYRKMFASIHKYGIAVLGAFIFGSDAETAETMRRKTGYILRSPVDVMQTTILTPLPGTRLYRQYEAENRLTYADAPGCWDRFDMSALTYRLKKMEDHEFRIVLAECQARLHSRRAHLGKFFATWMATGNMETAFWAYTSNGNYRNAGSRTGNGKAADTGVRAGSPPY